MSGLRETTTVLYIISLRQSSTNGARVMTVVDPSLISRTVSVDVKHHVYLLTYSCRVLLTKTQQRVSVGEEREWWYGGGG